MRVDGRSPAPTWLRGLDELEARVGYLESLVAKLIADKAAAPAPKKASAPTPKKADAPAPAPKADPPKKVAPPRNAPARKKR
jgi:hypothetical protein